MVYMVIHCTNCFQSWQVYFRDNWKSDTARTCPHCGSRIDKHIWEREILPAFGSAADANRELLKLHLGNRSCPLFTFDIKANPALADQQGSTEAIQKEQTAISYREKCPNIN